MPERLVTEELLNNKDSNRHNILLILEFNALLQLRALGLALVIFDVVIKKSSLCQRISGRDI